MQEPLRCPVCGKSLAAAANGLVCPARHSFDRAREGYVNLLSGAGRSGDGRGDSREMARSRHAFLNKGGFSPLADAVGDLLAANCPAGGTVLDICCGEGYYTARLAARFPDRRFIGFDLSREMVRLAARRQCGAQFLVANLSAIPLQDDSVNMALHLFAPFHEAEFARVMAPGGLLVSAVPGRDHLMGLKEVLYDTPYENDEAAPKTERLTLTERLHVKAELTLDDREDIAALFQMTPYYYHTPAAGAARLLSLERLTTPIEFVLLCYRK